MKRTFRLEGLGCANCAAKMEKSINELDGVNNATVNFITTKMIIDAEDNKMNEVIEAAKKIINKIEPYVVVK